MDSVAKLRGIRERARRMGLLEDHGADLRPAFDYRKKYAYRSSLNAPYVEFGQDGAQDYWDHGDDKKRKAFRARMWGIKLKDGTRAVQHRNTPAFLSYYLLW